MPVDPHPSLPRKRMTVTRQFDKGLSFSAKVATINVQGLRGCHEYVEDHLAHQNHQIAFLQETTRTKSGGGLIQSAKFSIYATDSKGKWGVATWFNKHEGALDITSRPHCIDEILHRCPRLLAVVTRAGEAKLAFFSGHCPRQGRAQ